MTGWEKYNKPEIKRLAKKLYSYPDLQQTSHDYYLNTMPRTLKHFCGKNNNITYSMIKTQLELEKRRVFVLIDMQPTFLKDIAENAEDNITQHQARVLRYCARNDIPVAVLEYSESGDTISELECELHKVPRSARLIKNKDDGFCNNSFYRQLIEWNAEELYLLGIKASACVLRTANSAIQSGFRIVTADNLIEDNLDSLNNKSRQWFAKNGRFIE